MSNSKHKTINSPEVKARLEALRIGNNGVLLPESVVEDARPPENPLHPLFEWDDTKAAHAYRVDQARYIIRTVRMTTVTEERVVSTIVYVHKPEVGYVHIYDLRDDTREAIAALNRELDAVESRIQRALALAEVLGLRSVLARLLVDLRSARTVAADGGAAHAAG